MYDDHHSLINKCLRKSSFQAMSGSTQLLIRNSITDAICKREKPLPVSFDLTEEFNVLLLLLGKVHLMLVLTTVCVFMDCFCPLHSCNWHIPKLRKIQCSFVGVVEQAIDQGWLNLMLDQVGCGTLHLTSIKVLSKSLTKGLMGKSIYHATFDLDVW